MQRRKSLGFSEEVNIKHGIELSRNLVTLYVTFRLELFVIFELAFERS